MYRKYFTRDNGILLLFMAIKVFLQYLLIHPVYDLQRDEYLHLDQANHPAWGYISLPPFNSWVAMAIKALGNDVFWVKFFPALFGAFTIFFAWKIVHALKGNLFAKILVASALLVSVLLRLNTLFQPNSFEVLNWTAFYFFLVMLVQSEKSKYLYLLAFVAALGFLNKYNILFMLAGLAPAIIISPFRDIFRNKHLYFAIAFFLLLVSPNILWQIQNNYPVIHHMKTLARTQLVNFERTGFLKDQVLFFINSLFILIAAAIGFVRYHPFRIYRFIGWGYLFSIALYVYLHAKSYYAIGLYPVFLSFGAVYLEYISERKLKWLYRGMMFVVQLGLFIPVFQVAMPNKSPEQIAANLDPYRKMGMLRWEDGKDHHLPQDFADMLGWRELAYKVDSVYNTLSDKRSILVLCDNYGQAGAINYYSINNLKAVTFNADYVNWFPMGMTIRHGILVRGIHDKDPERNEEKPLCDTVYKAGSITDRNAREYGTSIYVMKNIRVDVWPRLLQEIEEEKKY
jgi:hypothetical protein